MQISSVSYPQYSSYVFFEAKKPPKKLISTAKDKLGPRPSRELLEDLINNGMTNQEIAKKLKRADKKILPKKLFPILEKNGKQKPNGTKAMILPTKLTSTVLHPNVSLYFQNRLISLNNSKLYL